MGHKKEYTLSIHSKWVSRTSPIILQQHIKNATTELMQTDYLGFTSQGLQAQHFLFILMVAWLELHSKFSSFGYMELYRIFREKHVCILYRYKELDINPMFLHELEEACRGLA